MQLNKDLTILSPAQDEIVADLHRFRVLRAGRRFGKTVLMCWEMTGCAVAKADRIIAYFAPTFDQARDIAWATLLRTTEGLRVKVNESRLEMTVRTQDGGLSLIQLKGWESVERSRGKRHDYVLLDEVSSYKDFWVNWEEVLRPTLLDTKGQALFASTPKGFNHFYDLSNKENEDPEFKSFHFTSYDNPFIENLADELEKVRISTTEDRFAQEHLADFRKMEGLVYKEFDRGVHVVDDDFIRYEFGDVVERIAGIDFGYTNPAAVLTILRNHDNKYCISQEFYKTLQTDVMVAEYVKQQSYNATYPDPESPSAIKELTNRSVNVRPVIKNKDSIVKGVQTVRELLKQQRLFVHKSCKNTIQEFEMYHYPEERGNELNLKEVPYDANNHAMDALRYPLYALELKNQKQTAMIYTPSNLSRTTNLHPVDPAAPRVAPVFRPSFRRK